MTIRVPKDTIRQSRLTHLRDRDRPVLASDLRQLAEFTRAEAKDRGRKPSSQRPGSQGERAARELASRSERPLTDLQEQLLALLTDEPARPMELRQTLGWTDSRMSGVMSGLVARGRAMKTAQGWKRT